MNTEQMKVMLFGASGWVGSLLKETFDRHDIGWVPVWREMAAQPATSIATAISQAGITHVVNAAGAVGRPNVDACENWPVKQSVWEANVLLPAKLRMATDWADVPLGHVSTGCIFSGHRVYEETDEPNFCHPPVSSWYSHTKWLGEQALDSSRSWIWRIRMPFDSSGNARSILVKMLCFERLITRFNSMTYLDDFAEQVAKTLTGDVPFGVYHMVNGWTTFMEVAEILRGAGFEREWKFFDDDKDLSEQLIAPRSAAMLSSVKAWEAGLKMMSIKDALRQAVNGMGYVPSKLL